MRSIECRYGKTPVLNNPHLQVSAGEIIALIGKNGAGKSTLVTALCGLLKKQKGTYLSVGKSLSARQRIRESYLVLQEVNHQLFADSVQREITLGTSSPDEHRLQELLQQLDLSDVTRRHPMTLSGGQKQRVAIAAALFCEKRILVFDEQTSGLDYTHMMQMGKLLEQLREEDRFIFVISHDYEFVVKCCDRVICLKDGEVVNNFRLESGRNPGR
jgi:energy-coupling factor transport system ATP-binding protein